MPPWNWTARLAPRTAMSLAADLAIRANRSALSGSWSTAQAALQVPDQPLFLRIRREVNQESKIIARVSARHLRGDHPHGIAPVKSVLMTKLAQRL